MTDHYKALEIRRTATHGEVRAAYLHWAKQLHPDVNPSPDAAERFLRVKEAYEALGDPESRRSYDASLAYTERLEAERRDAEASHARAAFLRQQEAMEQERRAKAQAAPEPPPSGSAVRLQTLLRQSRLKDAEDLAQQMIRADSRSAPAWAALGDIARGRGDLPGAARCYAFAAQFDPRTTGYLDRHIEVTEAMKSPTGSASQDSSAAAAERERAPAALAIFGGLCVVLACWVVISRIPFFIPVGPLAVWTTPLAVSLLVGGIGLGASLSAGDFVDRLALTGRSALVRVNPLLTLGAVALASFWLALGLYCLAGVLQQAFQKSVTWLMAGTAATVAILAAASLFVDPAMALSCLMWGGALVYSGALLGWGAADSLRGRTP